VICPIGKSLMWVPLVSSPLRKNISLCPLFADFVMTVALINHEPNMRMKNIKFKIN
jgi:hypothetical protein